MRVRRSIYNIILLCLTIVGTGSILNGQNYHFTYYSSNDGLPTDLVKAVATTPEGFICIATDEGLVIYNGQTFTTYSEPLHCRYAKFVYAAPDGRMLISDDMGLTSVTFKGIVPQFKSIMSGSIEQTDTLLWYPKMLFNDARGNIWLTDNRSIYLLEKDKLRALPLNMKTLTENVQRTFVMADDSLGNLFAFYDGGNTYLVDRDHFTVRETTGILPDHNFFFASPFSQGKIWVAGNSGLWLLDTRKNPLTPARRLIIPGVEFSALIKLRHNLYIGSTWTDGIYEIKTDGTNFTYRRLEQYPFRNANYLTADKEGNVWIASDNGLTLMSLQMFGQPFADLLNDYIQHVVPYRDGIMATDGKKIIFARREKDVFVQQTTYHHKGDNVIIRILPVNDSIWMSDNAGNIGFIDKNGQETWYRTETGGAVFILASGQKGDIWFCQDGRQGIGRIDTQGRITTIGPEAGITSRIICIVPSPDGKSLYLGGSTDYGFLYRFDLSAEKAFNLSDTLNLRHNIPFSVNDIAFDNETIWLATNFGLLQYKEKQFTRADLGQITESTIKGITIDKNHTPWLTASIGIIRIDSGEYYSFDEREGVPSKTASYRSIVTDEYNNIWCGTISGLAFTANKTKVRKTPSPTIQYAELDGTPFHWKKNNINSFNNRSFLQLEISSPAYPGNLITYQYRLVTHHDTTSWQQCSNQLEHHLNSWEMGSYKIEIRARKAGNFTWSDPLILNLKVTKVWYETSLILMLMMLTVLTAIILIIRYNNKQHRIRRIKLEEEIEKRTREITTQKNFIENQRNSILSQNQELERKNIELTEARQKAEEFAKSRTMFLSTMSHELRTPLNAVIGMTYILLNEDPRPNQIENLQTLRFSAENLLALINDILDFSKIEAGKLTFEDVDFDLHEKISSIAQVLRVKADEKGVIINESIGQDVPQYMVGDSTRLNQILFNIAGNAVKFTHKGSISIVVAKSDETPTHSTLRFVISDTGIGISPEKIDTIFDSFTQAESEITRKYGGTGLGLAITKKLVDLQGGKISVQSVPGQGTTFTITLTYRKSEKSLKAEEPVIQIDEFAYFNNERVLVVDDNQINLIVARKFLTKWNLQVDTAENGVEAYELARVTQYKMILMDIQMPEMDGYTASKAIRQYEKQINRPLTPILALTASALIDVKERIIASGMNDFITKPFNPKELNYKIGKIIKD